MDQAKDAEKMTEVKRIAFIRCAGCAAGMERLSKYSSCDGALKAGIKKGECRYGCVGAGSCVEACKVEGAMYIEDGRIIVDREKCDGCGDCVGACPQGLIQMIPADATNYIPCSNQDSEEETRAICGTGCIGCGDCRDACPEGAINVAFHCASIDYDKCVGCVSCTVNCRKKIIQDTLHDLKVVKDTVAFVRCRGGETTNTKLERKAKTCTEAAKGDAAELGICPTGCLGFGACTEVCRFGAISVENGTAKVDPDLCVGCLDCVRTCPRELITAVPYKGAKLVPCANPAPLEEKETYCDSPCLGCSTCANNCPDRNITMEGNVAVVNTENCQNCKICSYVCPNGVMTEQVVPEHIYLQRKALGLTGEEENA